VVVVVVLQSWLALRVCLVEGSEMLSVGAAGTGPEICFSSNAVTLVLQLLHLLNELSNCFLIGRGLAARGLLRSRVFRQQQTRKHREMKETVEQPCLQEGFPKRCLSSHRKSAIASLVECRDDESS
jgi:hypothetical protein